MSRAGRRRPYTDAGGTTAGGPVLAPDQYSYRAHVLGHCREHWEKYHRPDALVEAVRLCAGFLTPNPQRREAEPCPLPGWVTVALLAVLGTAFRDASTTGPLRRLWKNRLSDLIDKRRYDCVRYGLERKIGWRRAGEFAQAALTGTPAGYAEWGAMLASYHTVRRALQRGESDRYLSPTVADQLFELNPAAFDAFEADFARFRAVEFLKERLAAGSLPETDIEKARCEIGLTAAAVEHARRRLRVRVRRGTWSLPQKL